MRTCHAAWVAALFLLPVAAPPAHADELSFSTRIADDRSLLSAGDIQMRFSRENGKYDDGIVTERRDQTVTLQAPASGPLRVHASERGGIRVQPSGDGTWSALVCMAAGASSDDDAQAVLAKLHVENAGGALRVAGPEGGEWAAYIVLSVPSGAVLELTALNGDLGLRDVSGHFTLRTTNGPISLAGTTGEVDGSAVNGPIHFRGHAGDIKLNAQNGPIGVDLDGATWSGAGLEAHTSNGPVELSAPAGLETGVEVAGSDHSPFKWSGSAGAPRAAWEHDHTVRLGTGPVLVRLSTVNGPVAIKSGAGAARHSRTQVKM